MAAVAAIGSVITALMPAISRAGSALVSSADLAEERLSSRIEIIHATGQVGASQATVWVKNTGAVEIIAISKSDVFFGPETNFQRIPYGTAGCTAPCWTATLENDTKWNSTATLKITIYLTTPLASGTTYFVRVVTPAGVEDSKFFTL